MSDATAYWTAAQSLSLYHLLSIHWGGVRHNLRGLGVNQICLQTSRDEYIADISRISGLPKGATTAITSALTLGTDTTAPDPALQPLVPIGAGRLAILGSTILSSNWSRNMLSLHARVSRATFDASSAVFEKEMIEKIRALIGDRHQCLSAIHIPTKYGPEEIDILLIDKANHSIMIVELRWMLQPGDVREVINRAKAVGEKVTQAARKVERARISLPMILARLGLTSGAWTVNGIVVIDGFGGRPSSIPKKIPVVPQSVFIKAISSSRDLEHLHAVFCTPIWLPRDGADFVFEHVDTDLNGTKFRLPGFSVGRAPYLTESLGIYFREASAKTIAELRDMPW
jgi:hypothetical protein